MKINNFINYLKSMQFIILIPSRVRIQLEATGQKSDPYIEEEYNNSIVNWLMAKRAEKPKKKK